jgi:PEP-CTERM motif
VSKFESDSPTPDAALKALFMKILVVALFLGVACHADTITEAIALTLPSTNIETASEVLAQTTSFAQLNPVVGKLNSVQVTLNGNATWSGLAPLKSSFSLTLALDFDGTFDHIVASKMFSHTGAPVIFIPFSDSIFINFSGMNTVASVFAPLIGDGATELDLAASSGNTSTHLAGSLQGAIVYNFTPAGEASAPEPVSLALLGFGLVGIAAFRRRPLEDRCHVKSAQKEHGCG